jgi:hypothetical protein
VVAKKVGGNSHNLFTTFVEFIKLQQLSQCICCRSGFLGINPSQNWQNYAIFFCPNIAAMDRNT